MKKRIISFVLMLVMLFSCLSPQVFATASGSGASAARAVAIESVINALKNPYEVTQSKYTEFPQ